MSSGYRYIEVNGQKVLEHRYVMEQYLNRKLNSSEIVHHINEIKTDNQIENLMVVTASEHGTIHGKRRGIYALRRKELAKVKKTQELAAKIEIERTESLNRPKQWLTIKEIMDMFNLTKEKVQMVMNLENLSYIRIGRIVRYNPLIIADFLERIKFNTV